MAQAEDTELRDLVIEALERNGSLAKIRALLRANIFLAFEDECENLKQNVNLDNILKIPEGVLALSVVHEFLEFCCLKNTLFVYMSESRQGNEYSYEGRKKLAEKMNFSKCDSSKEPILLTLLKNMLKLPQNKYFDSNVKSGFDSHEKCGDKNYREEQNCTYILHDSQSSTTSNSHSDNSSDEKNKLHLRLQLDNSDTDTSSDSARDKTSSEYVPGDHILQMDNSGVNSDYVNKKSSDCVDVRYQNKLVTFNRPRNENSSLTSEFKLLTNSSSDSTSYLELKPFNSLDEKMLNTAGLPIVEADVKGQTNTNLLSVQNDVSSAKSASLSNMSPASLSNVSSASHKQENNIKTTEVNEKNSHESGKSDADTAEFSYGDDFSSSSVSKFKENTNKQANSHSRSAHDEFDKLINKNTSIESPHQTSQSSQSSVSLSDVADLISEKSSLSITNNKSNVTGSNHSKVKSDHKQSKVHSDDSGDFTESPVPSLSNLSLDIHSD